MFQQLRCVALRTVKYDDRRNIVSAWSAECGRVGLIVPAGASREASRRRALMMPLGLFEGVADIRPGFDLLNIRDVRPIAVLPSLSASPSKAVVAMFLAEVLEKVLRESPADENLFNFIHRSAEKLDKMPQAGVPNFPLVFLCRLGGLMGIEPDISEWQPGKVFDMVEGIYRSSVPTNRRWLDSDEARVAAIVQRMTFESAARLLFPRKMRRDILDVILEYISLHLSPIDNLRSLPILREL